MYWFSLYLLHEIRFYVKGEKRNINGTSRRRGAMAVYDQRLTGLIIPIELIQNYLVLKMYISYFSAKEYDLLEKILMCRSSSRE